MNKFKGIITAWRNRWNPTPEITALAEKRLAICSKCPARKEIIKDVSFFVVCDMCGCPLEAKSHSPAKGACPSGQWDVVDNESKLF